MCIEVLVSTMNQADLSLVKKMNIQTDALIINQCDKEFYKEKIFSWGKVRMYSLIESGLSKSRNRAIEKSNADICIIADDDVVYENNYKDTVLRAYNKYPKTDIIVFNVINNEGKSSSVLKEGKIGFYNSMKVSSVQITFKRISLLDNGLKFNESFGSGARYICGEENILLTKCIRKGLEIRYVKEKLASVDCNKSSWFRGYNEDYFKSKGAMFYEISSKLSGLLILQFALRKWNLYCEEMRLLRAYKYMLKGLNEYKKISS